MLRNKSKQRLSVHTTSHVEDDVKETRGASTIWHVLIGGRFSKSDELSNAETGELLIQKMSQENFVMSSTVTGHRGTV